MRNAVLAFVAAALMSGCSSGLKRPVQEVTATTDAQGVQHVRLETHTFFFEPNRIVVKANQPVEIRIHNGAMLVPHNFTLKNPEGGLAVEADVHAFGGSTVVKFTPTRPGEY